MAEDGGEEAWLSWRSIPRLAASVASVPLVVGYASVGAARLLGRSVGEVLRGASWALECATKAQRNQWMKVPPKEVSVHLGSYPGGGKGDRPVSVGAARAPQSSSLYLRTLTENCPGLLRRWRILSENR